MFAECGSMDDKTNHSFARSDALYAPLFAFPAVLLKQKQDPVTSITSSLVLSHVSSGSIQIQLYSILMRTYNHTPDYNA